MVCKKCGNQLDDGQNVCPNCGGTNDLAAIQATEYNSSAAMANKYPMKWYNFLIYFGLFAGGVLNVINGIMQISGYVYQNEGVDVAVVYNTFGQGLHILDVTYGLVMIVLGFLCFIVRFKLASFSAIGPSLLIAMYVISIVFHVIYAIAVGVMVGSVPSFAQLIGQTIVPVIALICNVKYFNRRRDLFIN